MAETTLPVPHAAAAPRRRAFFGLFDADGWSWATVKALFWFVVIILLLGYLPDRAYYFTVQKTVDFGLLAWSPVNLCPPENETLPCPAPAGALVALAPVAGGDPAAGARVDGAAAALGTTYLYVGGSDGTAATDTVFVSRPSARATSTAGARARPARAARGRRVVVVGSTLYVIGGRDASGAPTQTVYSLTIANDGTLGEWTTEEAIALPEPRRRRIRGRRVRRARRDGRGRRERPTRRSGRAARTRVGRSRPGSRSRRWSRRTSTGPRSTSAT